MSFARDANADTTASPLRNYVSETWQDTFCIVAHDGNIWMATAFAHTWMFNATEKDDGKSLIMGEQQL